MTKLSFELVEFTYVHMHEPAGEIAEDFLGMSSGRTSRVSPALPSIRGCQ